LEWLGGGRDRAPGHHGDVLADRLAEEVPSQGGAISGRQNGAMGDLCAAVDDSESDHVFWLGLL
jgi:hypothetical protein